MYATVICDAVLNAAKYFTSYWFEMTMIRYKHIYLI